MYLYESYGCVDKKIKNDFSEENDQNFTNVSKNLEISNVRKSIAGDELRNVRLENDFTLNFEESIIPNQSNHEPVKIPQRSKSVKSSNQKMRIEAATLFVSQRLLSLNLQLSPTQPSTPMDGNCFIHALIDQMSYDQQYSAFKTDHLTLRIMIVNSLKTLPSNRNLEWPISDNQDDGNREV